MLKYRQDTKPIFDSIMYCGTKFYITSREFRSHLEKHTHTEKLYNRGAQEYEDIENNAPDECDSNMEGQA